MFIRSQDGSMIIDSKAIMAKESPRSEEMQMDKYLVTYEYRQRSGRNYLATGIKTEILTLDELNQRIDSYQDDGEYLKILFCQKLDDKEAHSR